MHEKAEIERQKNDIGIGGPGLVGGEKMVVEEEEGDGWEEVRYLNDGWFFSFKVWRFCFSSLPDIFAQNLNPGLSFTLPPRGRRQMGQIGVSLSPPFLCPLPYLILLSPLLTLFSVPLFSHPLHPPLPPSPSPYLPLPSSLFLPS